MAHKDHIGASISEWQRPAKTEEWAHEAVRDGALESNFFEYLPFPWATLIDLNRRGGDRRAEAMTSHLSNTPPRSRLIRATVCQHIWALDMLDWFQRLGVTDLFWPHAVIGQGGIGDMRIHPFPLFPVQCSEDGAPPRYQSAPYQERDILYNFIGAYDLQGYLSGARQWIFDLPVRSDAIIQRRGEWHFEKDVYHQQIAGGVASDNEQEASARNTEEYKRVLGRSMFSLCPSGSGPNSIRFWESLGFGAVPVLISDTLKLPGEINEWDNAVIRVRENPAAIRALPDQLERIASAPEKIEQMRRHGAELWSKYVENGPKNLIGALTQPKMIAKLVNQ